MESQAVIGFSFRLPQGVVDDDSLWDVLQSGKNLSTEWPAERAAIGSFYDGPEASLNKLPTRKGHFISDDPAVFDAPFFSITSQEAEAMDPQQRWVLETAYHAFENAGITVESLRGSRTAVFAGSMSDDYTRLVAKDPDTMPRMSISGTTPSILANRLSWHFNLVGPSMHIDSACSSSLTALDLACQSLISGNASQALVIGSSLMLTPESSLLLSNMRFLGPDGICHSFDESANGYARGEGIIAMLVKPVLTALRDGDIIRGIIRASCSNQDGRTAGLTQPSADAQERLIREAYDRAGLGFESTRYVEAHGTGTVIGDRAEMQAIGNVFKKYSSQDNPLYIGSVKSNIGHIEGGSGLAGVVKSILILERGIIPPNALFERSSPALDYGQGSLVVPTSLLRWPTEGPRRISINSFGFGGSNSHLILDDTHSYIQTRQLNSLLHQSPLLSTHGRSPHSPIDNCLTNGGTKTHSVNGINGASNSWHPAIEIESPIATGASYPSYLLVWSANDESATNRVIQSYGPYYESEIREQPEKLASLAYTLAARRSIMSWRAFGIVDGSPPLLPIKAASVSKPIRASSRSAMMMVFTGQGAQYKRMGLNLIRYPVFKRTLHEADIALTDLGCQWSIFDELGNDRNIHLPQYSQPLCTALQIALVELLRHMGLAPSVVVGHSSGEIAAAFCIGALSLRSAMKVAFFRGLLVGKLKSESGVEEAMMSVGLSKTQLEPYLQRLCPDLTGRIHVSCINSPMNCTVSGTRDNINTLALHLDNDQIFAAKLSTGVAYHSTSMNQIAPDYLQALGVLRPDRRSLSEISMYSSVTRNIVTAEALATGQYWVDNLISPVEFSDAVSGALNDTARIDTISDIVEIGPHSALRRPIKDILSHSVPNDKQPRYHSVLNKSLSSIKSILNLLGQLFSYGFPVSILRANVQSPVSDAQSVSVLINTPKYPFDHSRRYWRESRIARGYRFRQKVPEDSLGVPVADWNPLEPRWRNQISVESMPWTADHVVNNTVIYPGAGMLIMAIEAVKQIATPNRRIIGFKVREAHFLNPMIVGKSTSETAESHVHLRRIQNVHEKESTWSEVVIYGYKSDRWTKCFQAVIKIEYGETKPQFDTGFERMAELAHVKQCYHDATIACSRGIRSAPFYAFCQDHGFQYGEDFRVLQDISWDGKQVSIAKIRRPESHCSCASFAHPATLDAAFHISLTQASHGLTKSIHTMVPHQLFDTWISAEGWSGSPEEPLHLASFITSSSRSGAEAAVYTYSGSGEPLCTMGRLVISSVADNDDATTMGATHRLIHKIEWKPQLSLQTPRQLDELCNTGVTPRDGIAMAKFYTNLEAALVGATKKTMDQYSQSQWEKVPAHLQKLGKALRHQISQYNYEVTLDLTDDQVERILDQSEQENPRWRIFPIVARNLDAIFLGKVDALDLVYSSGLADAFYRSIFDVCCDQRFYNFLDLISYETPSLRILEVGAGTGGMTRHVLSSLHDIESKSGTTRYKEFRYTDISPSFFEKASKEFNGSRISFSTFDVENDPSSQGLESGVYDLVIAGGVLHATSNLEKTMENVRKLLKPGGRLALVEVITPQSIHASVGFGVLPGWWLSQEKHRAQSPNMTESQWNELMLEKGFSGTDVVFRDYEDEVCHFSSLMISSATSWPRDHSDESFGTRIVLVSTDSQITLARNLARVLGSGRVMTLKDLQDQKIKLTSEDIVVSLIEVGAPFLSSMSEDGFLQIQQLIRDTSILLWVTWTSEKDMLYPRYGVMTGLLRTMRMEAIEKRIISLAIESEDVKKSPGTLARYIVQVLDASVDTDDVPELEFTVRKGHLGTRRIVEHIEADEKIRSMVSAQVKEEPVGVGSATVLSIGTSGMLDTLQFIEDSSRSDELRPGEIEVESRAWAVSFRDVIMALGRLEGDEFGWDCAGVVTRTGPGSQLLPGDRVGFGSPGSMRTHVRAYAKHVFRIPERTSFEEAVSFINPACTAYHCLISVARLQKGEKVLIHSAAGSTGQMAVWIAKYCGAEIFATVGSEEKKQLLIDRFGIPASHILHSRNTSFSQGIMRLTGGYGVDVVLNSLSGDSLRASWDCVAPYGRFIEIGKADITSNGSLPMANFQRNVSFFAVDLHHMALTRMDFVSDIMRQVMDLISKGFVEYPFPRHSFPASAIEAAFRSMQSGLHAGRIIVTVDPSTPVPKLLRDRTTWKLDGEASYLVVGGLGGLGRAICRWVVQKGARYLILPSRSGPKSVLASTTVKELRDQGVCVSAPACDASSLSALTSTLDACAKTMPPVKGCINAAMALQDSVFETMTYSQWNIALKSKVDTAWNLHQLFPTSLDFYVLLSSLSGLYGSISLSNYAAGCTFQDALAHHRNLQGERSISIDIGWMKTIGIIAETETYKDNRVKARDMIPIEDDEFLSLLDLCCDPSKPLNTTEQGSLGQILIGATTPAFFLSRGETPIPQVKGREFSALTGNLETKPNSGGQSCMGHVALFHQAKSSNERVHVVSNALAMKLARALSVSADHVETDKTLADYGVDSLMAIELRNWFINDFKARVAVFEIMGNTPISEIGQLVVTRSGIE